MACLHCTSRVLRVFISGSTFTSTTGRLSPRLLRSSSRTFTSTARLYTPSITSPALPHTQRRAFNHQPQTQTQTSTSIRPLNDDDYIPFAAASEETIPSAVRERLEGEVEAGQINPVGPPPPVPEKRGLEEWDIAALVGMGNVKVRTRERRVRGEEKEVEVGDVPLEEEDGIVPKEVGVGAKEVEVEQVVVEKPAVEEKKLEEALKPKNKNAATDMAARLKARKKAAAAEEAKEKKEQKEKKARRKTAPAVETERAPKLASKPQTLPEEFSEEKPTLALKHRTHWKLPDPEAELTKVIPEKITKLEAYMSTMKHKDIPYWMKQKVALGKKFGDDGWNPLKKLSPDAMDGIRALHGEDPGRFHTRHLADLFEVSPEAIRRILKSKWRPREEEAEDRTRRWEARGKAIFDKQVEEGNIIPKSRKRREKEERKRKERSRSILDRPVNDIDRFL